MKKTLQEIAGLIGAKVVGDSKVVITGISGIRDAQKGDLAFIGNPKYSKFIEGTKASAVVVSENIKDSHIPLIIAENPSLAISKIATLFYSSDKAYHKGIHPSAIIGKDVVLGDAVSIGAYVVVEEGAKIGDRTVILPLSYIGFDSTIGQDCVIHSNVSIREKTIIKNRVIIHNGTVIGSDGFGYEKVGKVHQKISQLGIVLIEDDVEIGANVTIDRARLDKTTIGRGTKIDNLVQIAHNVRIGENCIIVAQAGISGSTEIGNDVVIAGQAGIAGHLEIGDGAIVGAQGGVTKSIPANTFVSGYPARPHKEAMKLYAYLGRLPELSDKIDELTKRLDKNNIDKEKCDGKAKNNKKCRRSKR